MTVLPCLAGVDLRSATRQQKLELEKVRLNFQRELELHKKVVLERVHAELAIIWERNDEDANSVDNRSRLAGVDLRSATRQQKLELENVRLNFQRELELHKKVVLERVHAQLAIIRERDDKDANSVDNRSRLAEVALSECRTDEGDTNDIPTVLREVEEEIRLDSHLDTRGTTHALRKTTLIKAEGLITDILMVKVDGPPSLQSSFWICLRMLKAMPRFQEYYTSDEEEEEPTEHPSYNKYGFLDHPQLQMKDQRNEFAPYPLPPQEGSMNGWLTDDANDSNLESTASNQPMSLTMEDTGGSQV
nr:hypothetical protein [Tanacetum cinerariifolium]